MKPPKIYTVTFHSADDSRNLYYEEHTFEIEADSLEQARERASKYFRWIVDVRLNRKASMRLFRRWLKTLEGTLSGIGFSDAEIAEIKRQRKKRIEAKSRVRGLLRRSGFTIADFNELPAPIKQSIGWLEFRDEPRLKLVRLPTKQGEE